MIRPLEASTEHAVIAACERKGEPCVPSESRLTRAKEGMENLRPQRECPEIVRTPQTLFTSALPMWTFVDAGLDHRSPYGVHIVSGCSLKTAEKCVENLAGKKA